MSHNLPFTSLHYECRLKYSLSASSCSTKDFTQLSCSYFFRDGTNSIRFRIVYILRLLTLRQSSMVQKIGKNQTNSSRYTQKYPFFHQQYNLIRSTVSSVFDLCQKKVEGTSEKHDKSYVTFLTENRFMFKSFFSTFLAVV